MNNVKYFFLLFLAYQTACVSVQLPTSSAKSKKATDYKYSDPGSPFHEADAKNSDRTWISSQTGSTISFFTSCSNSEPPIRNIRSNALQGIESISIKSEAPVSIGDREGLRSIIEGELEGIDITMDIVIFKKNTCSYQINYISLRQNFIKEKNSFETFFKNFRVN